MLGEKGPFERDDGNAFADECPEGLGRLLPIGIRTQSAVMVRKTEDTFVVRRKLHARGADFAEAAVDERVDAVRRCQDVQSTHVVGSDAEALQGYRFVAKAGHEERSGSVVRGRPW